MLNLKKELSLEEQMESLKNKICNAEVLEIRSKSQIASLQDKIDHSKSEKLNYLDEIKRSQENSHSRWQNRF